MKNDRTQRHNTDDIEAMKGLLTEEERKDLIIEETKKNIEFFEARRAELEAKLAEVLAAANARAEKINALETVTIASKAGDEGKLFGSIGTRDIADAVTAAGVEVAKSEVRLPNGVLRTTGEHEVSFQVHSEVFAKVIVNVVAE